MNKKIFLQLLLVWAALTDVNSETPPDTKDENIKGRRYWYAVAGATDIYHIDIHGLERAITNTETNKYGKIRFSVIRTLKGSAETAVEVTVYMDEETRKYLTDFYGNNRTAILFLKETYDRYQNSDKRFAARSYGQSLIGYDGEREKDIIEQIEFQREILKKDLYAIFVINDELANEVSLLIKDMTIMPKEHLAFEKLENRGMAAVPYIIFFDE
jgi:hypothetical protein